MTVLSRAMNSRDCTEDTGFDPPSWTDLHHLLVKQPHAAPLVPIGKIGATQRQQMRFSSAIQDSPSWSAGFWSSTQPQAPPHKRRAPPGPA